MDNNAILPVLQSFYGSKKDLQRCYGEFLWILVDELQTKQSQLDIITKLISIYHLTPSGMQRYNKHRHLLTWSLDLDLYASLDSPIRQAVKLLDTESFRASLELMSETLAWCPNAKLVHISTVFLKDSPEGNYAEKVMTPWLTFPQEHFAPHNRHSPTIYLASKMFSFLGIHHQMICLGRS